MASAQESKVVTTKKTVSVKGGNRVTKTKTQTKIKSKSKSKSTASKGRTKPKTKTTHKVKAPTHKRKHKRKTKSPEPKIIIKRVYSKQPRFSNYPPPPPPYYYPAPPYYQQPPPPPVQPQAQPEPEKPKEEPKPEDEDETKKDDDSDNENPTPPPAPDDEPKFEDVKHKNPHKWRNRFLWITLFIMIGIIIATQTGNDGGDNKDGGSGTGGKTGGGIIQNPTVKCGDQKTADNCNKYDHCRFSNNKCLDLVCSNFNADKEVCNNNTSEKCFYLNGACLDKNCAIFNNQKDQCEGAFDGGCWYDEEEKVCNNISKRRAGIARGFRIFFFVVMFLYLLFFLGVPFTKNHGAIWRMGTVKDRAAERQQKVVQEVADRQADASLEQRFTNIIDLPTPPTNQPTNNDQG